MNHTITERLSARAPGARRRPLAHGLVVAAGLAALVLGGCTETTQPVKEAENLEYVWPLPPEQPRIRYLYSVSTSKDIGAAASRSLVDSLVGRDAPPVLGLQKPYGVHADREGRIFVTDTGWGKLVVFDRANKKFEVWGSGGQGALKMPLGVSSDSQDRIYVTDGKEQRVIVFDRNGKYLMAMGRKGQLGRPAGIVINERLGRIYVADVLKHHIAVFDMQGNLTGTIGKRGKEPGQFNFPTNLAIDRDGNLYVVDAMNFRIQILDPQGQPLNAFGQHSDRPGSFARPKGIGVDPDGHIYVVDAAFNNFQIFNHDGALLLFVGGAGLQPGQFYLPAGAYLDAQGRLYVVDQVNQRVEVFQYLGEPAESPDAEAAQPQSEPEPATDEAAPR